MDLGKIERKKCKLTFDAIDEDGNPATPTRIDIALLASRTTPTSGTDWTTLTVSGGAARFTLQGPQANEDAEAIRVLGDCDLWVRGTDNPEVTTELVEPIDIV